MTTLYDRLKIFSTTKENVNFDGVDFSKIENIVKYHVEIHLHPEQFIIQISANILQFMEKHMDDFFQLYVQKQSFTAIKYKIHKQIVDAFHIDKLTLFGIHHELNWKYIINLLIAKICKIDIKENKFYEFFKKHFSSLYINIDADYEYIKIWHPLYRYFLHKMEIDLCETNNLSKINEFLKVMHNNTRNVLISLDINPILLIDISMIIKNIQNHEHMMTFLEHLSKFKNEYIEIYYQNVKNLYNCYKITNSDDIERYNIIPLIIMSNCTIIPQNISLYYHHLFDFGLYSDYAIFYSKYFNDFENYILDNWHLYNENRCMINKFLSTRNENITIKNKIKSLKYTEDVNNEFQELIVQFPDDSLPFSCDKCNFIITCSESNIIYPKIDFMPELHNYILVVNKYFLEKYGNMFNTITYTNSFATIVIEEKRIMGNLLSVNIILAINSCKIPLIKTVHKLLSHSIFINELEKMIINNYVINKSGVLSFAHLENNTIIRI